MKQIAYDYDKQEWIEGDRAIALNRTYWTETLDMLKSARGEEYAKFVGRNRQEFIAEIKKGLNEL
jgi:hypothetical protein